MATRPKDYDLCSSENGAEVCLPAILKTRQDQEKFKKYLSKIPKTNFKYLLNKVQPGEYFNKIAEKMAGWDLNFYLLNLKYSEVYDIKKFYDRDPVSQRQAALATWVQRDPNPTYINLLAIFVVGNFPCASVIINLLSTDKPFTIQSNHPSLVTSASSPFSDDYSDTIEAGAGFPPVEFFPDEFNEEEARSDIPHILSKKKDIERFKKYIEKIPTNKLPYLDYNIQQGEHFKRIAKDLSYWETNYYLLKLEWSEIDDIKAAERNPVLQREAALATWMEREFNPTYRNILAISVVGLFSSANVILELLS